MALVERSSTGADYPRKRTAIACEICRARRSKCDARKPACSKCIDLEVDCVYRKPNLWDREPVAAAANAGLRKVDGRLNEIQETIATLVEEVGRITRSSAGAVEYSSPLAISPPSASNIGLTRGPQYSRPGRPSNASFTVPRPHGHRMPNLLSFVAPESLGPFSYDSSEQFFTEELNQGDVLINAIENTISQDGIDADFAPQTCWRLQRAFVSGFLRWMPLFDDETCLQHVALSSAVQFSDGSTSSCLSLLVFAIGAMAVCDDLYHEDPGKLPGLQYFALAYKTLKTVNFSVTDLQSLQCQTLFSAYLSFAMRPVQSWQEVNPVSRACLILLKTDWMSKESNRTNLKERLYWLAYVMENELEVCLELPSSGIRTFQESIPLPIGTAEEEALYFFLALISLRKLLAEVIETIGFKFGHAIYVPIVAVELRNQTLNWHEHLPAPLQFPLDASPLFDLRKAHLRGQLFCLLAVIYWPFVLRHVENTTNRQVELSESIGERMAVHERAKECIECCILHLKASEGVMMQKTLVSHAALRAFYAIIMVLLLSYRHVHHCTFPPDVVLVITRSMEILSIWGKVPFMREPIRRVYCFAAEAEIPVSYTSA